MNRLIDGLCQALLYVLFFISGISLSLYYSFFRAAIAKKGEEVFSETDVPKLNDDFIQDLSL